MSAGPKKARRLPPYRPEFGPHAAPVNSPGRVGPGWSAGRAWALVLVLGGLGCGEAGPDACELWDAGEVSQATTPAAVSLQKARRPRTPGVHAIISGELAQPSEFAATGAILYSTSVADGAPDAAAPPIGAMICSGTLVAPDVVLAAGHCQENGVDPGAGELHYYFSLSADVSRFGPHVRAFPADAVRVRHFEPHPDYRAGHAAGSDGHQADLALLFLERPMAGAVPATILPPALTSMLQAGREVLIVGYGRRNLQFFGAGDGGRKTHGRSTLHRVQPYELQIGLGPLDAYKCWGDSGGPTYLAAAGGAMHLVGVTSRAAELTGCRSGGIDTRVDAYRGWIDAAMAEACGGWRRPGCSRAWRHLPS